MTLPVWSFSPDGPTLEKFLQDFESVVKFIDGPVGSGKTFTMCGDLWRRSLLQKPSKVQGRWVRQTRHGLFRTTGPALKGTTVATWLKMFPEEALFQGGMRCSRVKKAPYWHQFITVDDVGGCALELEIRFLAVEEFREDTVRSLELTAAGCNEVREFQYSTVKAIEERTGRYPDYDRDRADEKPGPTYPGLIGDTNAPAEFHWQTIMSGRRPPPRSMPEEERLTLVKPDGWAFYHQPPAVREERRDGELIGYKLNPQRENQRYLAKDYYPNKLRGASRRFITVQLMNVPGTLFDGQPVHPDFQRSVHVASEELEILSGTLVVGVDYGNYPAVRLIDIHENQWRIIDELDGGNVKARAFVRNAVKPLLADWRARYEARTPGQRLHFRQWGDPKGSDETANSDDSSEAIWRAEGIDVMPSWTNDPVLRIGAVDALLTGMHRGRPRLLISPRCERTIDAFEHGYHYPRIRTSGPPVFSDRPAKNDASHGMDAIQYVAVNEGAAADLLGQDESGFEVVEMDRYEPFGGGRDRWSSSPSMMGPSSGRGRF